MQRMIGVLFAAFVAACARDDTTREQRDVTEMGAAIDVIGRPEGADSMPPEMRDRDPERSRQSDTVPKRADETAAARDDSGYKRPERRPVRDIPPLTRPDSTTP